MNPDKPKLYTLGEYQRLIERFENCAEGFILPDLHLVIRIDAHRYGPEWDRIPDGEYPFGEEFSAALVGTAARMLCSGSKITMAFVHGDEISILLDPAESSNQRKRTRLLSLFASVGAICFLKEFPAPVIFHAKLAELPSWDHAVNYFMWQRKVAQRNCYTRNIGLLLAAQGLNDKEIDAKIGRMTLEERAALLTSLGKAPETFRRGEIYGSTLWWDGGTPAEGAPSLCISSNLPISDEDYYHALVARTRGESFIPDKPFEEVSIRSREFTVPQLVKAPPAPARPAAKPAQDRSRSPKSGKAPGQYRESSLFKKKTKA